MPLQMALDEILFRGVENGNSETFFPFDLPIFRIFFSSEPWVTVGYSHDLSRIPNPEFRIPVCRRMTGGGIVEHGRDLIFSIVARKTDDESFKSVRLAYLKIHEAVKAAFEAGGLRPRFYRCDENLPRGRECFGFPIATDLALGDKKVAGGAQKRSSGALLHQESIQDVHGLDLFDLAAALRLSFEKTFDIQFKPLDLDPRLLEQARVLADEKYIVIPAKAGIHFNGTSNL